MSRIESPSTHDPRDGRDCDVALIGTGLAPLVAASHLISQGKTVLVLNPDYDFFLEDSELPLDPMLPLTSGSLAPEKLRLQSADRVLEELGPPFPGAVEAWSASENTSTGFRDLEAPHIRQRVRLWIQPRTGEQVDTGPWSLMEDAYVGASDAGLNPRILEGLQAVTRFPGYSPSVEGSGTDLCRGLWIPKICDVDVSRYRSGILEFVRERLEPGRFVVAAAQIEPMPGGLRFYSGSKPLTARVREKVLVFWTPRMSSWVISQAKRAETEPRLPLGVRLWEQWSLISREDLDPEVIGSYAGLVVWAEVEGRPRPGGLERLSVLRSGPLLALGQDVNDTLAAWASGESMSALSSLCYDFFKWNRFSIRSMKARALLQWPGGKDSSAESTWELKGLEPPIRIIPKSDGPLVDVVRTVREAIT